MADQHMDDTYPDWKLKLMDMGSKSDMTKTIDDAKQENYISQNEIALKHPSFDSIVRLSNDGCIDIFASQSLGIRLDPATESVNIYGENINFFGKKINMKTKSDGLVWNDHYFNTQVFYESDTERDQYVSGNKEYWVYSEEQGWHWQRKDWQYKPMIKTSGRTRYSEGMIEILSSLGLPVE